MDTAPGRWEHRDSQLMPTKRPRQPSPTAHDDSKRPKVDSDLAHPIDTEDKDDANSESLAPPPLSEDQIIEQRRKRRAEIRARHTGLTPPSPPAGAAVDVPAPSQPPPPKAEPVAAAPSPPDDDDEWDMFGDVDLPKDLGLKIDYDEKDGHYRVIPGETIDEGRYKVIGQIGKGSFAVVVRAIDLMSKNKNDQHVAIKMAANNTTTTKAADKELMALRLLNHADKRGDSNIIRLRGQFTHKKHACLVFEDMQSDARTMLKKFDRDGFPLKPTGVYAEQLFNALAFMRRQMPEVMHADVKPDNILIGWDRRVIKLCDFGTALLKSQALPQAPMLVSRYYRPPELVLGLPYGTAIDMWSVGCTLFELYTGKVLFEASDNYDLLRRIQHCFGRIAPRLIRRAKFERQHFNIDSQFLGADGRPYDYSKPIHPGGDSLKERLMAGAPDGFKTAEEAKLHDDFLNLLTHCLEVDPERRIKPHVALGHTFLRVAKKSTDDSNANAQGNKNGKQKGKGKKKPAQ